MLNTAENRMMQQVETYSENNMTVRKSHQQSEASSALDIIQNEIMALSMVRDRIRGNYFITPKVIGNETLQSPHAAQYFHVSPKHFQQQMYPQNISSVASSNIFQPLAEVHNQERIAESFRSVGEIAQPMDRAIFRGGSSGSGFKPPCGSPSRMFNHCQRNPPSLVMPVHIHHASLQHRHQQFIPMNKPHSLPIYMVIYLS
jgi:hypothetical protein